MVRQGMIYYSGGNGRWFICIRFYWSWCIYGQGGTDTVKFTGATSTISADTNFNPSAAVLNTFEKLDLTTLH